LKQLNQFLIDALKGLRVDQMSEAITGTLGKCTDPVDLTDLKKILRDDPCRNELEGIFEKSLEGSPLKLNWVQAPGDCEDKMGAPA